MHLCHSVPFLNSALCTITQSAIQIMRAVFTASCSSCNSIFHLQGVKQLHAQFEVLQFFVLIYYKIELFDTERYKNIAIFSVFVI